MNLTCQTSQSNADFTLGEPFDRRVTLLVAYNDARQELQRVQGDGTSDDILNAKWAVAEKLADLNAHEHHLGTSFVMGFRFALQHCTGSLSDLFSEVPVLVELADAIADLEDKGGRR